MRISTITNWAYGLTLVLTSLSAAAFLVSANAADKERAAVERHLTFDLLAEDLAAGSNILTNEARLYAVRGAARHLEAYRFEVNVVRTRDRALERVRSAGASPGELAAIAEGDRALKELTAIEAEGVETAQRGDRAAAQAILFGPEHERAEASLLGALDHFRAMTAARTETDMLRTQRDSLRASEVAKGMLGLTALLFLGVLYFVLRRRVSAPLTRMSGVVQRLARQDYTVAVPNYHRRDEIGDLTDAMEVFRQNGLERDRFEAERRADQAAKDAILQMMHRLEACNTREELAEVVACFAPQIFPDLAGRLYVFDDNRNALSRVSSWLDPLHSGESFAPSACWGLRRGRPHASHGEATDISCPHIADADVKSLCIPLTAQGDTIGLLYFEERPGLAGEYAASRIYVELMADNVGLTLANLRLRERLSHLAVRDALTGLFNRRSLDEALKLRADEKLACIMIDIDHFKQFNDDYGHDAGDVVMQRVANLMREVVGEAGSTFRFGGEEFTVLLPDGDEASALACAEALRTRLAGLPVAHHGKMLPPVTVSLGVAASPGDGPVSSLLRCADTALLDAKSGGRNRTVTAGVLAANPAAAPSSQRRSRRA